jgi:nucleoside permease NupC
MSLKTQKKSISFKYVLEALIVELWLAGIYLNIFLEIIYMQ